MKCSYFPILQDMEECLGLQASTLMQQNYVIVLQSSEDVNDGPNYVLLILRKEARVVELK